MILLAGGVGLLVILFFVIFWVGRKSAPKKEINPSNSPYSQPTNNHKTEIKLSWAGQSLHSSLSHYWKFATDKITDPNVSCEKSFYFIAKNHPLLQNKRLDQEGLSYTLSYQEKEVVKSPACFKDKNNEELIGGTILESGFNFVPNGSWEDWVGFENRKTEQVELVNFIVSGGNAVFKHGEPRKNTRFLVDVANPIIQKLRNDINLIIGKKYLLTFSRENEYKKYYDNSDFYYFDAKNKQINIHSAFAG